MTRNMYEVRTKAVLAAVIIRRIDNAGLPAETITKRTGIPGAEFDRIRRGALGELTTERLSEVLHNVRRSLPEGTTRAACKEPFQLKQHGRAVTK